MSQSGSKNQQREIDIPTSENIRAVSRNIAASLTGLGSPLNLIIGAGPAGLLLGIGPSRTSKHKITILDSSHALSPIGVGIHVPPNSTLVLQYISFLSRLEAFAMEPEGSISRRYKGGSVIADIAKQSGKTPYTACS